MVRFPNRTIGINLVKNTTSQCSAGSPCPAHCLNVPGLGGARRPGECQKRIHTVDLALQNG